MANILEEIIKEKKDALSIFKKNNSLDFLEKKYKTWIFLIILKKQFNITKEFH